MRKTRPFPNVSDMTAIDERSLGRGENDKGTPLAAASRLGCRRPTGGFSGLLEAVRSLVAHTAFAMQRVVRHAVPPPRPGLRGFDQLSAQLLTSEATAEPTASRAIHLDKARSREFSGRYWSSSSPSPSPLFTSIPARRGECARGCIPAGGERGPSEGGGGSNLLSGGQQLRGIPSTQRKGGSLALTIRRCCGHLLREGGRRGATAGR